MPNQTSLIGLMLVSMFSQREIEYATLAEKKL